MSLLAEKYSESVKSVFSYHYFQIYQIISGLNIYEEADKKNQRKIKITLRQNTKLTAKFAEMQSDNYKWGVEFIAAETDRILHEKFNPSAYYNAIESARKGSMMLPAMIIRLQLVRIMMKTDHPDRFDELEKVRAELMNYEMDGIVQVLNQTYQASPPQPRGAITKVYSASTKGTNYISNLQFDSLTFIKSIEALTGELQLDKLLNRLMNFALENAGADYGCFMLRRGAHFDPVIEMYADGGIFTDQGEIPATIFNYVVQSREPLMLSNASEGAPFSTDSLVMKNNERSTLPYYF